MTSLMFVSSWRSRWHSTRVCSCAVANPAFAKLGGDQRESRRRDERGTDDVRPRGKLQFEPAALVDHVASRRHIDKVGFEIGFAAHAQDYTAWYRA